jgi:prepilin-type processing-associated H-X9-DG protein
MGNVRWRHNNERSVNVVYADGHASTMTDNTSWQYRWWGDLPLTGSLTESNFFPVDWAAKTD